MATGSKTKTIGAGRGKFACPNLNCQYSTSKAGRLETHKNSTGHGRDQRSRREDRSHLAASGKKK